MKRSILLSLFLLIISELFAETIIDSTRAIVTSPDKNYSVTFYQKQNGDGTRAIFYKVDFKNQPVIKESVLDIQLDNNLSERAMALPVDKHIRWCENLVVKNIVSSSANTSWTPVYGEQSSICDRYNAVTIEMVKDDNPIYLMNLEIRAYNEGVAL